MQRTWILGAGSAVLGAAIALALFVWFQTAEEREREAADALAQAREALEAASGERHPARASGLLTQALTDARRAAAVSPTRRLEAGLLEGEALIRLTKYTAAIETLESLVAAFPQDAAAAELAAEAHRHAYLLAKRDRDFAAAIELYERAAQLGPRPSALAAAAVLAESVGHTEWTDRYFATLEERFPNSDECAAVKALRAARANAEGGR